MYLKTKKAVLSLLLPILLLCLCGFICRNIGFVGAETGGYLKVKDTEKAKSLLITHSTPHSKDGVIIEFDLLSTPSKMEESGGAENNRIRLAAGMVENYFCGANTLSGTGLQAAGLAIDVLTNEIMYYPNGLCYEAKATLTGAADNGVTAVNSWNYTTEKPLFEEGYTYRAVYDFTPSDYTDSMTLLRKSIGGTDEFAKILTVANYIDPFTGTNDSLGRSPAVNTTESGYAGLILEDINIEIDNFNVYGLNGEILAEETFDSEMQISAIGKVNYNSLVVSAYDRDLTSAHGNFGVKQDSGSPLPWVTNSLIEVVVPVIIPELNAEATLSLENEVFVNYYLTIDMAAAAAEVRIWNSAPGADTPAEKVIQMTNTDGRYTARSEGYAAKELGDTQYIQMAATVNGEEYTTAVIEYGPKTYAMNKLNDETASGELKSLCVALLDYGAAAQNYFGYKTDNLANTDITDEMRLAVAEVRGDSWQSGGTYEWTGMSEEYYGASMTLTLEGSLAVNGYIQGTEITSAKALAFMNLPTSEEIENETGAMVVPMTAVGNSYRGTIGGIAAKEIFGSYYIVFKAETSEGTVTSEAVEYGARIYAYNMLQSESASLELKLLCESLLDYGAASQIYFNYNIDDLANSAIESINV